MWTNSKIEVLSVYIRSFSREYVDTKAVFGYFLSLLLSTAGGVTFLILHAGSMGLFISIALYVNAFSEDLKNITRVD